MEVTTKTPQETKKLASRVAKKLKPGDILALYGDLGSGKTTFTRYLVGSLGIRARVQSPTFVIARIYLAGTKDLEINSVNHIDLYRIGDESEVINIGLEDYFNENDTVTVIEWPEVAKELLPSRTIVIKFEYIDDKKRKITIQNLH